MDFSLVNIPNRLIEHANTYQGYFRIISLIIMTKSTIEGEKVNCEKPITLGLLNKTQGWKYDIFPCNTIHTHTIQGIIDIMPCTHYMVFLSLEPSE